MFGLAELIAPVSTETFFREYWNRRSLLVRGDARKFPGLFAWSEINRIAKEHRLQPPQIRLAHEGKSTDDLLFLKTRVTPRGTTIYSIDIPVLYRLLKEGASLVLDAVDEMSPTVSTFCESLGRDFACQFSVNAYAVWGSTPGFGVHWDDHDLFVVQVSGRKHWRLFGATRPYPLDRDVEPNPFPDTSSFEWEAVVEPGDVIYIPRGHWHGATGVNDPSLHLTCGMNNPTGVELLNWLADDLRREEIVRTDIPRYASPEERGHFAAALREAIVRRLESHFLDDYVRYWHGNNQARTNLSLPYAATATSLPDHDEFSVAFSGISATDPAPTGGGTIAFETTGKRIELPASALALTRSLLSGTPLTFTEMTAASGLPSAAVRRVVSVLVQHGVVHLVSAD